MLGTDFINTLTRTHTHTQTWILIFDVVATSVGAFVHAGKLCIKGLSKEICVKYREPVDI
jgi:hypothetical protein